MSQTPTQSQQKHPKIIYRQSKPTLSTLSIALLLFCIALVPRLLARGDIITVDEAYHWFDRVHVFLTAVLQGDYASTNIVGHPGVTTMWLGAMGLQIHTSLADVGWIASADANPALLHAFLRAPIAVVTALSVALAYPLLLRLVSKRVALIAVLFWAAEPFIIAHSQLLHLDALLTSFVTLSLLAALVAYRYGNDVPDDSPNTIHWLLLGASAIAGGLALLTKSPSVILFPMMGLIMLVSVIRNLSPTKQALDIWVVHLFSLLVWATIVVLVWFALWLAAWVDLAGVIQQVTGQAVHDGGAPHGWGNFFLGQSVEDPGWLFYPVAIALRVAPWTFVGVVIALGYAISFLRKNLPLKGWRIWRTHPQWWLFVIFVLLFVTMMSIPPKKFDRYVLPIFPMLNIIAAAGLVHLWDTRISHTSRDHKGAVLNPIRTNSNHQEAAIMDKISLTIITLILTATVAWYHPYELAYYNPLLGGGKTATKLIPVGWGEGYEQAGAFISAQPNACERAVASWFIPVFRFAYDCPPWIESLDKVLEPGAVNYAVLYIDQIQRNNKPEATEMLQTQHTPMHTVTIHGIEYASVYQLPHPNQYPLDVQFGDAIHLIGYDIAATNMQHSGTMTLTLQWEPLTPITQDYNLFVHVFDAEGNQVGQIDVPPGGPHSPTSSWIMHGYVSWIHQIPITTDISPKSLWLTLGIYEPDTFQRLPVSGDVPQYPNAPDDGANTLVLETVGL